MYRGPSLILENRDATVTCGVDGDNWIALEEADGSAEMIELPRWSGGVGGMELVASRDERYVALHIYSGQSSQGYEVFATEPALAHLGGMPEELGHGSAPVFSPEARWLATLLDTAPYARDSGEHFEDIQDDEDDELVIVDWARLYVQALPAMTMTSVDVGVEIPRSTDRDLLYEWRPYGAVRFAQEDVIALRMPWGEELLVTLPPGGPITSRGFTR
jgi:hypothetical protein